VKRFITASSTRFRKRKNRDRKAGSMFQISALQEKIGYQVNFKAN